MSRKDAEPFRLRAGEPVPAAITRIAHEEIEISLARLGARRPNADAVHEVRKATKRLRALLRLVRDDLGARTYRRENYAFRDAARLLSGARDTEVLIGTLAQLGKQYERDLPRQTIRSLQRTLRSRLRNVSRSNGDASARRSAAALARAERRLARWKVSRDGWPALEPGLHRIFRRGRAAWRRARVTPSVANLHEWRKRVKDLRYAMELLEPLWPPLLGPFAKEVDDLADLLGEDHDLAMLHAAVQANGEADAERRQAIVKTIDEERQKRQQRAWALAPRIYREKPAAFVRRIGSYWDAWRVDGAARQ